MAVTCMTSVAVAAEVPTAVCAWTPADVTWRRGARKAAASYRYSTLKDAGCSTSTVMMTDYADPAASTWTPMDLYMLLISETTVSRNSLTCRASSHCRTLLHLYLMFSAFSYSLFTKISTNCAPYSFSCSPLSLQLKTLFCNFEARHDQSLHFYSLFGTWNRLKLVV